MKIISSKKYNELKTNKRINTYLANGFRANQLSLSFELAIINILEQFNVNEIEIPFNYFKTNKYLVCEKNEINHTFKVKILEKSDK